MTHEQAVSFIKSSIIGTEVQYWADLGCGSGTFTKALAELLPAGSHIIAIDRDKQRLQLDNVDFVQADIERDDLNLAKLDGVLIANALHYVADPITLIRTLKPMFSGAPRFVIIEYDTDRPNFWVPYPLNFSRLNALFRSLGYDHVEKLNERRSTYGSGIMYCALIS